MLKLMLLLIRTLKVVLPVISLCYIVVMVCDMVNKRWWSAFFRPAYSHNL